MKPFSVLAAFFAVLAIPSAAYAQAHIQLESGIDSISVAGASNEGVVYGLSAGYDLPIGESLFVGLEGNFTDSTAKASVTRGVEIVPGLVIGFKSIYETRRDIAATLRVGSKIGDSTRVYVLGGYANSRIRMTRIQNPGSVLFSNDLDGYRIGAGIQRDFGSRLYGRLEYRYSNYEGDFSRHNGIVALGVKF